jgi:hypothetical protein
MDWFPPTGALRTLALLIIQKRHQSSILPTVHSWRSCNFLRPAQHFRPHLHVRLLHAGCDGTGVPEVRLVEAAHDHPPDGPVRRDYDSRIPIGMLASSIESFLSCPDYYRDLCYRT